MFIKELKYMEGVNKHVVKLHDIVEKYISDLAKEDIELENNTSNELFDILQKILEEYSETGIYKNHN